MRLSVTLAALISVGIALPAVAQKRAPTVHYDEPGPTPLDKNFGLPTFGMPGSELPKQRTQAPEAQPPEQPDVFAPMTGLVPPEKKQSDEPDFFADTKEITLPTRPGTADGATPDDSTTDTPLFTTGQGYRTERTTRETTTDEMTTGSFGTSDRSAGRDPAGGGDTDN